MTLVGKRMIVSIQRAEHVELARAVIEAAGDHATFYLLFGDRTLSDHFGETSFEHGFDPALCVLNADAFSALLSFGPPKSLCAREELLLTEFFNEVGLSTIKIQSNLLEPGFSPWHEEANTRGKIGDRYAESTALSWSGDRGVGYVKSELVRPSKGFVRKDLILITSAFEFSGYSDKECHQFAIAVVKLALNHPELTFVFSPRAEEVAHARGAELVRMIEDYDLANLSVEKKEPLLETMARCGAAISMMSTALLDLGLLEKPVLLFSSPCTDNLCVSGEGTRFRTYFELEERLSRLREAPSSCRHKLGISALQHDILMERLSEAEARASLAPDHMQTAVRYYAMMREGHTTRERLDSIADVLNKFDGRLTRLEKSTSSLERTAAKLPERVTKVLERIGILQRSTLAYKVRKLAATLDALQSKRRKRAEP